MVMVTFHFFARRFFFFCFFHFFIDSYYYFSPSYFCFLFLTRIFKVNTWKIALNWSFWSFFFIQSNQKKEKKDGLERRELEWSDPFFCFVLKRFFSFFVFQPEIKSHLTINREREQGVCKINIKLALLGAISSSSSLGWVNKRYIETLFFYIKCHHHSRQRRKEERKNLHDLNIVLLSCFFSMVMNPTIIVIFGYFYLYFGNGCFFRILLPIIIIINLFLCISNIQFFFFFWHVVHSGNIHNVVLVIIISYAIFIHLFSCFVPFFIVFCLFASGFNLFCIYFR